MKKLRTLTTILAVFLLFLVPATSVQAENTHSIDLEASNSEYLSISDAEQTGLDLNSNFTFEISVKLESLPADGNSYILLSKDQRGSAAGDRGYIFWVKNKEDDYIIAAGFWNGSSTDPTQSLSKGETSNISSNDIGSWVHFAVTCDTSSQNFQFYKNGQPVTTSITHTNATSIANNSIPFRIGSMSNAGSIERHNDAIIDEARVWDDIRTSTEIANNYNTELTGSEANLVGYWKFNDSLLDTSGYNNTLTSHGASFSTDVPFTDSTETASCSCTGDNIDFEVATDLLGTGSQNMVLGTDSGGVPTVCVNEVGGSFLDEFTFFNDTWTPVSVTQIPGTDQISVIAYDAQGSYSEQIVNTSSEEIVATNDL